MSDDKLEDLEARLKKARHGNEDKTGGGFSGSKSDMSGLSMAFRTGTELVSALIVGVGIGLFLDYWLDTSPWFLVVFFFLGAGAGVLNVYRAASGAGYETGYLPENNKTDNNKGSDGN